jgi:hypothetical protein
MVNKHAQMASKHTDSDKQAQQLFDRGDELN